MVSKNIRFIERDYWFRKMKSESDMSDELVEEILNLIQKQWGDYTFKVFENGSLVIVDNNLSKVISPKDLDIVARDFYIRQRLLNIWDVAEAS